MSVRWEKLAGDTAAFALKISFLSDPHEGRGVDPDMAASWGAMQLWVDGVNISAYVNGAQGVDAVYWYLLPQLEWLTTNWDALLHEQRLPNPESSDAAGVARPWLDLVDTDGMIMHQLEHDWAWRSRHELRSARDGGVLPGVYVRRHNDEVEISWRDRPLMGAEEIRYITPRGRGLIDPQLVASSIHSVLVEAVEHLLSGRAESVRIRRLRDQLRALQRAGSADVRLAWLAGLGSGIDEAGQRWGQFKDLARRRLGEQASAIFTPQEPTSGLVISGSPSAALLFSSVSPTIDESDAMVLVELAVDRPPVASDPLANYTVRMPFATALPAWEQGYELAEDAREALNLGEEASPMADVMASLRVHITEVDLQDPGIRGVTIAGRGRRPTVAVNRAYPYYESPSVRQFTLAHELCHLLFDVDFGVDLAVASGPWAPTRVEQRANAFAAMFLMPPQLLRLMETRLGVSLETPEGLAAVSADMLVSQRALLEHGRNVGLISVQARDRLARHLDPGRP